MLIERLLRSAADLEIITVNLPDYAERHLVERRFASIAMRRRHDIVTTVESRVFSLAQGEGAPPHGSYDGEISTLYMTYAADIADEPPVPAWATSISGMAAAHAIIRDAFSEFSSLTPKCTLRQ